MEVVGSGFGAGAARAGCNELGVLPVAASPGRPAEHALISLPAPDGPEVLKRSAPSLKLWECRVVCTLRSWEGDLGLCQC
jgi:hypothetical protein